MRKSINNFLSILTICFLVFTNVVFGQNTEIKASSNQILNWDKSHTIKLNATVFPEKTKVKWTCDQNPEVKFKDPTSLVTEVTFPRPGYYLLTLSGKGKDKVEVSSTVLVNVFKYNSYKNRLSDLIGLMTIEEKINQLTNETDSIPRLDIPYYNYWSEALHGVLVNGATSFPQCVALGSSWDPDLVYRIATAISDEARIINKTTGKGLTYWSPTVNIARDPRWGRNEESYSEDPYLLSRMGVSFIKGMQGDDPYYFKVIATPKHFIANNEEERRHSGSSDVNMRNLYEYYLPAFYSAIVEGKAYSIMGAYNELNQVPSNANSFLMNDLLRREWGFQGYVVSDCGAVGDMVNGHFFYETNAEASAYSILAGCDLDCGSEYRSGLREALERGLLEEKDIDSALTRVLSARFRMGEFDPPEAVPYASIPIEKLDGREHRALALEAAQKSIVLLKNDGILPFDKSKIKSIAVMGPNALETQLGIYSGGPNIDISPLEGINSKAKEKGISVDYTLGTSIGGGLLIPIQSRFFKEVEGTGIKGLKAEYFDNMKLSGKPVLTRIDTMVDFSYGYESPAEEIPVDQFSARWSGTIVPTDTVYHIGTSCDDGARLYLDGKLIIDDWIEHGEKPKKAKVTMLPGKEYDVVFEYYENGIGAAARLTWDMQIKDFSEAKSMSAKNDAVVLFLGISPGISQEELDRPDIELPEIQRELIKQVSSVNPNVVVILVNGGPLAFDGTDKNAKAIVEAWYAGEMGGAAIADILFGDVNPSGKLPETFYASTEQLPPMWDYDMINNPRTYMYFDQEVLFPFGHGLSYTNFVYSNLKLATDKIGKNEELNVQFDIQNTGQMKGDEIAQLYVRFNSANFKVPINQLKRFERVTLEPGETKTISLLVPASEITFYNSKANKLETEPGQYEIQVGASSRDIRLKMGFNIE